MDNPCSFPETTHKKLQLHLYLKYNDNSDLGKPPQHVRGPNHVRKTTEWVREVSSEAFELGEDRFWLEYGRISTRRYGRSRLEMKTYE